jgi:aminopeptidase N
MKLLVVVFVACSSIFAFSQPPILHTETHLREPGQVAREHPLDMQRMKVEVSFDPPAGVVSGKVTHYFKVLQENVDSIYFDAIKINILEAKLGGKPLRFISTDNGVTVYPEKTLHWEEKDSITFVYKATPRRGIYFIGWKDSRNLHRKQIWTQGQGIDNRHWIPMYDDGNDKMITETVTTFDKEYEVLSNGTKLSVKENKDGTKTWHYRMTHPHSSYLLMLGIGKYAIDHRKTKAGVPVHLYYYPEHPEQLEPTYRYSTECIDFVADWTGVPYPWESYSQIPTADFIYGAMENTTATVFGDFFLNDKRGWIDRSYIGVNVHELTHQWYGDLVTCREGSHNWLQESFATFFPKLFTRKYFGEDAFQWNSRGEQNGLVAANDADRYPIVHSKMGGARAYGGGSAVLGMMLYTFGEDALRKVLNNYTRRHAYGNVETNDIYQSFQDTLGLAPDWFFDQWLYRGGYPHYEVSYQNVTAGFKRETQIKVSQIHAVDELTKYFKMPIVFEVHYEDGTMSSAREWISKQTETVSIPNPGMKNISYVLFDPGSNIVKKVTFKKPFIELRAQILNAPNMIDRYDALVALKSDPTEWAEKKKVLFEAFGRETFHATKSEIITQLAQDSLSDARAIVLKGLKDPAVEVRTATLNAFRMIPRDLLTEFEVLLKDSSYNVIVAALDKFFESNPPEMEKYLIATGIVESPGKKVRIKSCEYGFLMGHTDMMKELIEYTSSSYEFTTRQNAIEAIKRLGVLNEEILSNLLDAYFNPNNRLSGTAYGVLTKFYEAPVYRGMMSMYTRITPMEQWQRDMIANVIK